VPVCGKAVDQAAIIQKMDGACICRYTGIRQAAPLLRVERAMPTWILLHPDLGVSSEQFVADWNSQPASRDAAEASLERQPEAAYGLEDLLPFLADVAVGVLASALYDLIKETLLMRGVRKRIEVVERMLPDGTRVVTVTGMEE
jgi:hypothetical protein